MPIRAPAIRRASTSEITLDQLKNPADLWYPFSLKMRGDRVAQAATALWGDPVCSAVEGEALWKLRIGGGEECPAYISVGLGEPSVLFSAGQVPGSPGQAEELVEQIRRMLSEAG